MNKTLEKFARDTLKALLRQCNEKQRRMFRGMYGTTKDNFITVVNKMSESKLDWAITQVQNTIKKFKLPEAKLTKKQIDKALKQANDNQIYDEHNVRLDAQYQRRVQSRIDYANELKQQLIDAGVKTRIEVAGDSNANIECKVRNWGYQWKHINTLQENDFTFMAFAPCDLERRSMIEIMVSHFEIWQSDVIILWNQNRFMTPGPGYWREDHKPDDIESH